MAGLVIPSPIPAIRIQPDGRSRCDFVGEVPAGVDLRQHILFWDEFAAASYESEFFPCSNDYLALSRAGILRRVPISSDRPPDIASQVDVTNAQISVFEQLDGESSDKWFVNARTYSQTASLKRMMVRLGRCLPTPSANVSVEATLAFKTKRRTEYVTFRNYLEEIYLDIAKNGDPSFATHKAAERLAQAIRDCRAVARESKLEIVKTGVEVNVPAALVALTEVDGLNLKSVAKVIGAAFHIKNALGLKTSSRLSPVMYAALVRDQFGADLHLESIYNEPEPGAIERSPSSVPPKYSIVLPHQRSRHPSSRE